jgi:GTPase involved in cell partitioning and DNA repair
MSIDEIYESKCNENSDIFQHLPTLKEYAEKCCDIVELGVRSIVSTWAFLAGKPRTLISVDLQHPSYYKEYDANGCDLELVERLAKEQGIGFRFIQHDSITVELPVCDMMFFDTVHTYHQLSDELFAHGHKVEKYLVFHDTEIYKKELMPAIREYMNMNLDWKIEKIFTNNNGLLIMGRK